MPLRECLDRVLSDYLTARRQNFAGHDLAYFIRHECPEQISRAIGVNDRLMLKGSAGQGTWTYGPWIGIFDRLVTTSAQRGYYPVYLFREDMEGVYLSLNQGITEAKAFYKGSARTALNARSANFRAMLGEQLSGFPELEIDLASSSTSSDTAFYEAGNICATFYPAMQLPREDQLVADLHAMLQLYEALVSEVTNLEASTIQEDDVPPKLEYEDASQFRLHKRIERNAKLVRQVKNALGYSCQVCSINFGELYGEIGKDYIEAHHLTPLASLKGQKIAMRPKKDFAVLCANCHRMIHRSGCVANVEEFRVEHYKGKALQDAPRRRPR